MKTNILKYNNFHNVDERVTFNDYICNKQQDIHAQLYNNALEKFIKANNYNTEDYLFIEIKQDDYFLPSYIYVRSVYPPFKTEKKSLKEYWDNYEYTEQYKQINDMFFDEDVNVNGLEIIYIDYIKGTVRLYDKITGKVFEKKTKYINDDLKYSKEHLSLENTFSYKVNNKIYGK